MLYSILGHGQRSTVTPSSVTFSHPAGIDVLVITAGKFEVAFVSDKGNSAIQFIKGGQTFTGERLVGTVSLHPTQTSWRPEGLTVISKQQIAVTAGLSVNIVSMDTSLTSGKVVQLVSALQSSQRLCFRKNMQAY